MPVAPAANCGLPHRTSRRGWVNITCLAALLTSMIGCGGEPPAPTAEEQQDLKAIAVLYGTYSGMNRGGVPQSADDMKAFAAALKQNGQVPMGLDLEDIESVFVSPRDNQPYVLLFGNTGPATGTYGDRVIAYEQTGKDGMRQIAFSNTEVIDASAEDFSKYVPDAP